MAHTDTVRRIYTEEKAKVVAAVWGIECIQFLAALAVLHQDYTYEEKGELHQDDKKKRINSSCYSNRPGEK